MYSMLHKIDNHIRDNNLEIKNCSFSAKYLPLHLSKAILHEVRSFNDEFFDSYSKEITFTYDKCGRPIFVFHDVRKRFNIVVLESNYMTQLDFKADRVVIERDLINNMYMLKYLEHFLMSKRLDIIDKYPNASQKKRNIIEYKILCQAIKKYNEFVVSRNIDLTPANAAINPSKKNTIVAAKFLG